MYIDPGQAMIWLTVLIGGGIVGGAVLFKLFAKRILYGIKSKFTRRAE
jgi:hypothetical protein